jgi:hypothetical protein
MTIKTTGPKLDRARRTFTSVASAPPWHGNGGNGGNLYGVESSDDPDAPCFPDEGEEISAGRMMTLRLTQVTKTPLPLPSGATVDTYQCAFRVRVRLAGGVGLGGCAVIIDDKDFPAALNAGGLRGTTDDRGLFTGVLFGAVENIQFVVKDPAGTVLVSGDGRVIYDVSGTQEGGMVTLRAEVSLATSAVTVPAPTDTFTPDPRPVPFVGVDANVTTLGGTTPGFTDAKGEFTAPSGSGAAQVNVTWPNSRGMARRATRRVP